MPGVLLDDSGAVRGEIWQEHRIAGPDEAVDLIAEVVGELSARDLAVHELSARELPAGNGATGPPRALTAVGLSVAGWLSRDRRKLYASGPGLAAQARAGAGQPEGAPILALAGGQPEQISARQVMAAARGGDAWRPGCSPGPGAPSRGRWPA